MGKVTWRGVTVDDRTAKMLDELAAISGKIYINPTQGSYSTSISASAGTHSGGGAVDLMHPSWSVADYDTVAKLSRKIGFAGWHRTPQQSNWPRHCHLIAVQRGGRNDKGVLSTSAHSQVKAYYDGKNGLANNGKDDGVRAYVGTTWETYLKNKESGMTKWFKYSGKPEGVLWLEPDKYINLDARIPAPTIRGLEFRMCYLNVTPTWKLPKDDPMYWFQTAVLRVRWTRAGKAPDSTGYQTFVMTPWDATLISHTHWEMGQANRGGFWSMRLRGMVTGAVVATRYTKGAIP